MSAAAHDPQSAHPLREDARAIWQAAVDAVNPEQLVRQNVRVQGRLLHIGDELLELDDIQRILVVGAGKAGAAMAAGLEAALGHSLLNELDVIGWVNVPADGVRPLQRIKLHAARPAGLNEPTAAGVEGAREILHLVENAAADDLCIALISGGGSALLPAPVDGVTLEDKLAITRALSAAGANIAQLNTARTALSRIKGGGLAAACRAGRLIALIVSDVLGDPLEIIASGPTVASEVSPQAALAVLDERGLAGANDPGIARVREFLSRELLTRDAGVAARGSPCAAVTNTVIGNLAVAVDAAGLEADRRGYDFALRIARGLEGEADEIGGKLADLAVSMLRNPDSPNCLIDGGEPVVTLGGQLKPGETLGRGGRNQQLVLAAFARLQATLPPDELEQVLPRLVILSGGTDGEDGPTDAAGAVLDADVARRSRELGLRPGEFLRRNDAYAFFAQTGGLLQTGPTGTNVCDVRVILTRRA